ncbi:NUDIX domain-containing protein [Acaricomes phytoseiuli]|uniref:NUDIX hydrolase n=1 Tax=Acaricomes phytoseiuli TaxID=291968 RepID=UPI00036585CA|nr:NUDIX domain-containing protein [Acaricomes phytoseiuli]MCW1250010.1 NUDIX domain-containing protein [Acaricomes phytoseiuli]
MPVPEFIIRLREKVGNDLLWLPGVAAVVLNEAGEVLLVRRSDNGRWALVTGILDPGEEPAVGLAREVFEETGVQVEVERLLSTGVVGPITFPNGDVCTFLNLSFLCRYRAGTARVNDDESLEVAWCHPQRLPELNPGHRQAIAAARAEPQPTEFVKPV